MKTKLKFIIILITSILGAGFFQAISTNFTSFADPKDKTSEPEQIKRTCYEVYIPPKVQKPNKTDLENRLNILEKQYKDKLIDKKTYKQSKENILKQIHSIK